MGRSRLSDRVQMQDCGLASAIRGSSVDQNKWPSQSALDSLVFSRAKYGAYQLQILLFFHPT